jgi:putative flippase GtrA
VYECAISYNPRTYEEGKKIGWKDGIRALYCIFHYSAHNAPLPMQILIYLFIGAVSLFVNLIFFTCVTQAGMALNYAIIVSFTVSALCNYLLCIAILFQHKARWNTGLEIFWYIFSVLIMGAIDFGVTRLFITLIPFFALHWSGAKFLASLIGFIGNFILRKILVFPEKKKQRQ